MIFETDDEIICSPTAFFECFATNDNMKDNL